MSIVPTSLTRDGDAVDFRIYIESMTFFLSKIKTAIFFTTVRSS